MGIFEVFYQPGKLFSGIETRRNVWVLPLILTILVSAASIYIAIDKVGLESAARQRLQNANLSPEQMQQQMQFVTSPLYRNILVGSAVVAVPIVDLALAGLFTLCALVGSKQPKFSNNFSLVVLAYFPYALIAAVMAILVVNIAQDPTTLDINNLLSTNIGAFLDRDTTSKFLYSFLTSMDVLVFAEIGLLSYGFSKVNRTTMSFGFFAIVIPWFIFVLGKAALAMLF